MKLNRRTGIVLQRVEASKMRLDLRPLVLGLCLLPSAFCLLLSVSPSLVCVICGRFFIYSRFTIHDLLIRVNHSPRLVVSIYDLLFTIY